MPKINYTEMPLVELRNFCRTFSEAIERAAKDPVFLEIYNRHRAGKEVETSTNENSDLRGCNSGADSRCDYDSRTSSSSVKSM